MIYSRCLGLEGCGFKKKDGGFRDYSLGIGGGGRTPKGKANCKKYKRGERGKCGKKRNNVMKKIVTEQGRKMQKSGSCIHGWGEEEKVWGGEIVGGWKKRGPFPPPLVRKVGEVYGNEKAAGSKIKVLTDRTGS